MLSITAAVEILLRDQIEAIALAFLVVVLCCLVVYRSSVSGIYFYIDCYDLQRRDVRLHGLARHRHDISAPCRWSLGIGLGVDYAFYIVDAIKSLEKREASPMDASTPVARLGRSRRILTALTLAAGVLLWSGSSLRFQAEMGI